MWWPDHCLRTFLSESDWALALAEGTESSHMHEEWDENYRRGYEWSMMVEAKKVANTVLKSLFIIPEAV